MNGQSSSRTVIVTGAGTGIGRAIARRVLRDGYRCVLAGPDAQQMEETIALAGAADDATRVVVADVRDPDDRIRIVETAAELPGSLYGLVNNAGITRLAPLLEESVSCWTETLDTNLTASFFLAQAAIDRMRPQQQGRIVNIASVHGIAGRNDLGLPELEETPADRGPIRESAYAASKGGLLQLTRDLATAVGRWGITVNAVSPGFIEHPRKEIERRLAANGAADKGLIKSAPDRVQEAASAIQRELISRTPLRRLGRVEDIAGPVSFLLSEDAAYVTGANLVADGGWTIW